MKFLFYGLGVILIILGALLCTLGALDGWDATIGGWLVAIGVFALFGAFVTHMKGW